MLEEGGLMEHKAQEIARVFWEADREDFGKVAHTYLAPELWELAIYSFSSGMLFLAVIVMIVDILR